LERSVSTARIETVVVGGGQAGLATSYHLSRQGREHVVLEQADRAGNAWRNDRWDSFTLVTPNWAFRLPGVEYTGDAPDAFMPRDEIVSRFERWVEDSRLPVRFGVRATSVERAVGSDGYRVTTDAGSYEAANVVVATGLFQHAKVPPQSAGFPAGIEQLHSGAYRNPRALRDGAILVVGSAQSGCQIAQELYQSGRRVYLCTGGAGRVPRRYRGKDIFEWMNLIGFLDRTVADLPSPHAKFAPNPHVSGRDGGQDLNLHRFARDGVVLLGHLAGVEGDTIHLSPDLKDNLATADRNAERIAALIDHYIERHGLDAPAESLPVLRDGYEVAELGDVDLSVAGISTVIWAIGYSFDFGLVKLPVFDGDGFPITQRGATEYAGLFFVGMPYLYKWKSGLLVGVGEDAEYVASRIVSRNP
jgi:putative flavoprotein involved in K+ transport